MRRSSKRASPLRSPVEREREWHIAAAPHPNPLPALRGEGGRLRFGSAAAPSSRGERECFVDARQRPITPSPRLRGEGWGEGRLTMSAGARTLVYLHGFRSSPASIKATRLSEYVAALPAASRPALHVPELTDRPAVAIAAVAQWVERHADAAVLTFVGSSLGGYYATHLAERYGARAVMINPAVRPVRGPAAVARRADQPVHGRGVRRHGRALRRAARAARRAHHAAGTLLPAGRDRRRGARLSRGRRVLRRRVAVRARRRRPFVHGLRRADSRRSCVSPVSRASPGAAGSPHARARSGGRGAKRRFGGPSGDARARSTSRSSAAVSSARRSRSDCATLGARLALLDEGDVAHRAARGNFGLIWVQGKGLGMPRYARVDAALGARVAARSRRCCARRRASTSRCGSRAACTCACRRRNSTRARGG